MGTLLPLLITNISWLKVVFHFTLVYYREAYLVCVVTQNRVVSRLLITKISWKTWSFYLHIKNVDKTQKEKMRWTQLTCGFIIYIILQWISFKIWITLNQENGDLSRLLPSKQGMFTLNIHSLWNFMYFCLISWSKYQVDNFHLTLEIILNNQWTSTKIRE